MTELFDPPGADLAQDVMIRTETGEIMTLMEWKNSRKLIEKGGEGSGHFGHEGREGKRGGSLPSGATGGSPDYQTEEGEGQKISAVKAPKVNLRYVPNLESEARSKSTENGVNVELGPKFFKLSPRGGRANVLAHEVGHEIIDRYLHDSGVDFWDISDSLVAPAKEQWGGEIPNFIFNTTRADEALSEAYAVYVELGEQEFKNRGGTYMEALDILKEAIAFSPQFNYTWSDYMEWANDLPKDDPQIKGISTLMERGGPGSGHYGHEGRPGEVGGSLPSGATATKPRDVRDRFRGYDSGREQQVAGYIMPEEDIQERVKMVEDRWGLTAATNIDISNSSIWMMPDGRVTVNLEEHEDLTALIGKDLNLYASGFVRINIGRYKLAHMPPVVIYFQFDTRSLNAKTRKAMSDAFWSMHYAGGEYKGTPGISVDYWDALGKMKFIEHPVTGSKIIDPEMFDKFMGWRIDKSLIERGGEGSGHFGHEGRPGEVGGSLPSGETAITEDEEWSIREDEYAYSMDTGSLVQIIDILSEDEDGEPDEVRMEIMSGPDAGAFYNGWAADLEEPDWDEVEFWTEDTIEATVERAKEIFGVTDNWREAGYILESGEMLDFSGKNQGGSSDQRGRDHREINQAFVGEKPDYTDGMVWFMDKANAIRMSYFGGFDIRSGDLHVDFAGPPTRAQRDAIETMAMQSDAVVWDVSRWFDDENKFRTLDSGEVDGGDLEAVEEMLEDVRTIYYAPDYEQKSWIVRTLEQIINVIRGGEGSGHFGHEGRPGEVGGSLPSGATAVKEIDYLPVNEHHEKFVTGRGQEAWLDVGIEKNIKQCLKMSKFLG